MEFTFVLRSSKSILFRFRLVDRPLRLNRMPSVLTSKDNIIIFTAPVQQRFSESDLLWGRRCDYIRELYTIRRLELVSIYISTSTVRLMVNVGIPVSHRLRKTSELMSPSIVLYLYIYIVLRAMHTNQKRLQCDRPREKRAAGKSVGLNPQSFGVCADK